MLRFKQFTQKVQEIYEHETEELKLPPAPGTIPIPEDHVRLYHQTSEENLRKIEKEGIQFTAAKGIEGPKAIWATEHKINTPDNRPQGFYGFVDEHPTVEFSAPKKEWEMTFPVLLRDIKPHEIIATHYPWQSIARNLLNDPSTRQDIKNGTFDDDINTSSEEYPCFKAARYIRDYT